MESTCPRCHYANPSVARFCARCGLMLAGSLDGALAPGRIRSPDPLGVPDGFEKCRDAVDLWFRWESAWGGSMLLGTEGIGVVVLNGGYPLENVALAIRGEDGTGKESFSVEQTIDTLPRGEEVTLEIASYELPDAAAAKLTVSLVSAEFAPQA